MLFDYCNSERTPVLPDLSVQALTDLPEIAPSAEQCENTFVITYVAATPIASFTLILATSIVKHLD